MLYDARSAAEARVREIGQGGPDLVAPGLCKPEIVIIFAIEREGSTVSQGFDPKDFKDYGALGLGWSIVASLIVCILGGVVLDQYLDTAPVLTLIGVALGLMAAGYLLYELTLINRKDREAGPIGRKLAGRKARQRDGGDGPTDSRVQ
jgi:ATP synthase protein I